MKYHKLVRDNITKILKSKGVAYKAHIADSSEYWAKLKLKLGEEVAEFTTDESIEELADIEEVKLAIMKVKGWTNEQLEETRAKKHQERGGFDQHIILEES